MSNDANDTVLITGGAGFIGSHLAERLVEAGRPVVIFDDLSTGGRGNLDALEGHPLVRFHEGSVVDERALADVAAEAGTIVHLAAAVGVQLIMDRPVETLVTNVRGTENVLEAARRTGSRVLMASTSEAYGKGSRYPFAEDDDIVLGPSSRRRWAYAASKLVDEFFCFAYRDEFGVSATPFRLFNTVGARQTGRYGMVIPRFVRQALAGEPITLYGDGTQRRCFCDVRDAVTAIAGLLDRTDAPVQVYNIGGTEEVTIRELAQRVVAATGSSSEIVTMPYEEVFPTGFEDMQRRIPSTDRIRALLDWTPRHSLDDIIESVVSHERANEVRSAE